MYNLQTLLTNPTLFLVGFIALALSIGIHEFSHVLSAYLQGDMTGKMMGRLTLNPIKHLDPWGTVMMVMAGIGWGKPAPFNPNNLRYRRWGSALVAIAGPISNLILVLITGYAFVFVEGRLGLTNYLTIFLGTMVFLNAALAVFNLIPITPLDGSHLLKSVAPVGSPLVGFLERFGPFLLIGLVFFGRGILGVAIFYGVQFILKAFGLGHTLPLLFQTLQLT